MRSYKLEAVVLSKKRIGEADAVVKVYSREMGKLTLIAKGVRKLKSRKRGSLDNFSHVGLSVSRTYGIHIIDEATLIESFSNWKKDLKRVSIAYYISEVIDKLTGEGEKNEAVFYYLLNTLVLLKAVKSLKSHKDFFSKKILVLLGFWADTRELEDPDKVLREVVERELFSIRVGKKILN